LNIQSSFNNPYYVPRGSVTKEDFCQSLEIAMRSLLLEKLLWIIPFGWKTHFATIVIVNPLICFSEKKENWNMYVWDSLGQDYFQWDKIKGRIFTFIVMVISAN
jgi:hypothetical protein